MEDVLVSVAMLAVCALVLLGVLAATLMLRTGRSGFTLLAALERRLPSAEGGENRSVRRARADWSNVARRLRAGVRAFLAGPERDDGETTDAVHDHTHAVARGAAGATPLAQPPGPARAGWFGPYRLDRLLGQGAMGQVWRAYDTRRQRWVALKLLPTAPGIPARARERMQREARLAGALCSAHVIPVHDFGRLGGTSFLDMRLVPDGDLAGLLRAHRCGLDLQRTARITTQIADALDAAHAAGLVHCDVKPSNVLLDTTSSSEFCYLADFGIATLTHAATRAATWVGSSGATLCGTPTYMAPELFTSADTASPASDVYALGVLTHELLIGRPPFLGPDLLALHRQHTHQSPPRLSATATRMLDTTAVDDVLACALAKDPRHRHPSAGAFAAALSTAVAIPALTQPEQPRSVEPSGPFEVSRPPGSLTENSPDDLGGGDSLDAVFVPHLEPASTRARRVAGRLRSRSPT